MCEMIILLLAEKWKVKVAHLCLTLCHPLDSIQSREFSRPGYWSG